MSIEKRFFGKLDGKGDVDIYKITNKNGAFVELMTLGAGIHSINVPDRNGKLGDVVLGFDDVNNYLNPDLGYQGLVVGRYANRIRDAKFSMDGVEYNTPKNQGTWTLHGGGRFSFNIWEVKETGIDFVLFSFFSPDMQDGFPGNFSMNVKYTFDDSNTLKIEYFVLSDKKTVANPTNHAYFNLSADSSKTVEDEYLQVNADKFTETDDTQLPTGELGLVEGTMMDFRTLHKIGELTQAAVLYDEVSGRQMQVYTDLVGIQVYCGGWLAKDGNPGKGNSKVTFRRGVALETQFYPDSVNHSNFPFKFVEPNEEFKTTTEFRFSVK